MLEIFYPDKWIASTYQIPWETLYEQGVRGAIFDIDNTLVPHDQPADDQVRELFERLQRIGIQTFLLYNNKEPRMAALAAEGGTPHISKAGKPSRKSYLWAMEQMETDRSNTVFVGDQLFTDVYGAKRTGIYSILVTPINPKEEIQIVLKRYIEAVVLYFYKKKCENSDDNKW